MALDVVWRTTPESTLPIFIAYCKVLCSKHPFCQKGYKISNTRRTITRPDGKEQVIDSGTVRRLSPSERSDMVKGVESDMAEVHKKLKPSKTKPRRLI